jgi:beta-galactosidase
MIVQPLGFRSFRVDTEQGFFLNGNYLDLHGVNRHQDLLDHGWATSWGDDDRDFSLISEIGATAVRLAHYQHNQHVYDLTDRLGFVVWAEIPNIDSVNTTPEYLATTQNQLLELIRQNYNHPSIVFWSVGNELENGGGPDPTPTVQSLNTLAKAEDPSRLTTLATWDGIDGETLRSATDVIGYNVYVGWYFLSLSDVPNYIDELHQSKLPGRPLCVSEDGAGASMRQHQSPPSQPDPGGPFHPEEWQSRFHETYWKAMKTRTYLWGKFVWSMFDFASDERNEGDTPGRNDKGLVTYDRATRKDAFYWYKANWSSQPTVYITERRYNPRASGNITVRVYSNLAQIELKVNGASQGVQTSNDHIFSFNITLPPGATAFVEACGNAPSGSICDSVSWTAQPFDIAAKTQSNLGAALYLLGKRESGTAKLEAAVVAHREALTERTRDRAPLDWATSFGNEGVALMLLAERRGDVAIAETAVSQINTAFETMRESGPAQNTAEFELMLSNARALVARLRRR